MFISDSGAFCVFFLIAVQKHHYVALIENEKCPVNIAVMRCTDFIHAITDELHEPFINTLLYFEHSKNIINLLLRPCFKSTVERDEIVLIKQYLPF